MAASSSPSSSAGLSLWSHALIPLSLRPMYLRLDVYPFVILYLAIYKVLDPLSVEPEATYDGRSLAFRVAFPLALIAHLALFFLQLWSLEVEAKVGYYDESASKSASKGAITFSHGEREGSMRVRGGSRGGNTQPQPTADPPHTSLTPPHPNSVRVVPPPNSGAGGIVPLTPRTLTDPSTGEVLASDLSVTFQKVRGVRSRRLMSLLLTPGVPYKADILVLSLLSLFLLSPSSPERPLEQIRLHRRSRHPPLVAAVRLPPRLELAFHTPPSPLPPRRPASDRTFLHLSGPVLPPLVPRRVLVLCHLHLDNARVLRDDPSLSEEEGDGEAQDDDAEP